MDLKFWQPKPCLDCAYHKEQTHKWMEANVSRVRQIEALDAEIETLKTALKFSERPAAEKPTEVQILTALELVREDTPLWRAVHRLIDLLESDQKDAVCRAVQTSEDRHYNAGRLAMCEELRSALLQKWVEARRQNQEAQQS